MRTVKLDLPQSPYQILIGQGLLDAIAPILAVLPQKRVVIVSNTTVAPLYMNRLCATLGAAGVRYATVLLPDGEQYKTFDSLQLILESLLRERCERKTTLIALGGGVVGDITGLAASLYQRGMPFIQIPTTLLAQVDSSVGGKTAINHPLGKNMIGAFHQPSLVLADLDVLKTLPDREYSAGLAEVIKYGLIDDLPFLEWLEANMPALVRRDPSALEYAVERSCQNKARIVAMDEREEGVRALLNLGHTFGHAIEAGLGYGVWLHGEAVGAGMWLAAHASAALGNLSESDVDRIARLLRAAGLPAEAPALGFERWMSLMAQDKKVVEGRIRFVLLKQLGLSYIDYLSEAQLRPLLP
ncbi:3-dehydroquinate synthase [Chitinimonas sp. BJYL2]|uniref:3-dehydroquinate synthase n=1 Tax=Chitinimonas sp. BJYL2 TaxID=2976696 RepID=UPI0022B4B7D7|nr:3-dehydroquinate synthase [Chitinimonas sp. BJYL2]